VATPTGSPLKPGAPHPRQSRWVNRAAFYAHLWIGVIFTFALLSISITGIILNHKRGLGLMPDVPNTSTALFTQALPLAELALKARAAAGPVIGNTEVDRMDVRPGDGLIKVRFSDEASTEVTLDIFSGKTLHIGRRGDVFLEKLHSGEIFGKRWVLLSDAAAIALTILLITGYWLWLVPRWRNR
jgi:hypothetical protein